MNAPTAFIRTGTMSVDVIGIDARRALMSGRGEIAAVFRRSFYVRMKEGWACGGTAEIGCGPLNFLFTAGPDDWRAALAPGQPVIAERNFLWLPNFAPIGLGHARTWTPEPFPDWSPATLATGLAALERLLGHYPPPSEGLGCFALQNAVPRELVARTLALPIKRYLHWLAAGCPANAVPGVEELIGAGPGLTPSGDDFLAGSLLGLHAIRRGDLLDKAWAELESRLSHRTHAISAAHLSCAAVGRLAEVQHSLLNALLSGSGDGLGVGIQALFGDSHTSSWDGLAGMACTLRALSGYQISIART